MNAFAISGLLIGISSLLFGIFVFVKNRTSKINRLFTLLVISVTIWGLGSYKVGLTIDPSEALFWWRITYIGIILIPVLFCHFVYLFLELKKRKLLYLIYFFGLFFLILEWTPWADLFFGEANITLFFSSLYFVYPRTFLFTFFVFAWLAIVIYNHYELYKAFKKSSGIKRSQIKYFFLATVVGFAGGCTCFLPCFGIKVYPVLNFTVPLYPAIMAYAILKYRLMDIRVAIGKSAVYVFSFATVIALALGMMFLNNKLILPVSANIAYIAILVVSIFLFQPVFRFFEKIANRYFYYTFYSSQKVITNLGKKLTRVLELNKLTSLIADTLINTMKLDKTGVLLKEPKTGVYQIQKIIGFEEENGISLVKDNFLTFYLEKTKKPLVYEELSLIVRDAKNEREKKRLEELRANMERIEADLCLPLFREGKIIGMIILGSKISREPYSQQDIDLLITLSNQASIALENAKLYDQVQDLSQNLQKKVDEQTREIKESYEVEKKAHKELKRIDKAKSQFMMATQHHLRTPLTSMRGYLDLILGGSYGELKNKKIKRALSRFEISSKRLSDVVNELLDISQFQLGRDVVFLQPDIKIEPILEEIMEELIPEAKSKNIYFKLIKAKKKPPLIKADSEKLKVALTNIVDNAIKYTNKGGVAIKIKYQKSNIKNKPKLQIIIKDTGMGISKEELKVLFTQTFERGEQAKKVYTTGRGIGLYIASQIIEAHKGRVWAESKGKGRGSVFYIELPVR